MNNETPAPLIVVFPRGQLTAEDKAAMQASGVIAVEADDPSAVQQLQLRAPLIATGVDGDAIVRAALMALASQRADTDSGGITTSGRACHEFVRQLAKSLPKPAGAA